MALLNIDDDPWVLEYESCEKLQRDIMEQLKCRQKEPRSTETYARLSVNIRIRLKQYHNEVHQLQEKMNKSIGDRSITYDEIERRGQQIELLKSRGVTMDKMFNELSTALRDNRTDLLGAGSSGWSPDDDDMLVGAPISVNEVQKQKQKMMRDQEEGLDNLAKIIARQKNIAQTITTEVDLHNDIIDDLGEHMERTDARVNMETRNVTVIDRKDKSCVYWVIIVLLFLSIIATATI